MRIITDGLDRPGWGLLTTLEVSQDPGCDALTILVRFEAWQGPGCENHWRIFGHYLVSLQSALALATLVHQSGN